MTIETLTLSMALSDNERTRPIAQGRVKAQGLRLVPTVIHPSEMFWRQLKYADFDVSEMSLSSLFIATARGDKRWVALPVYTSRSFFHTNILVRTDRGIVRPEDLRGKRVGVPEYQQTAALWLLVTAQVKHAMDLLWGLLPPAVQNIVAGNSEPELEDETAPGSPTSQAAAAKQYLAQLEAAQERGQALSHVRERHIVRFPVRVTSR